MVSDSDESVDSRAPGTVPGCLFCGVVNGEVPADVVARRPLAVAFRDIHPLAPVHVLVVPRRHIIDAAAIGAGDAAVLAEMFVLAYEVAALAGVAESGYRLVLNVGEDSGNSVGHLHLHLLGGRSLGLLG